MGVEMTGEEKQERGERGESNGEKNNRRLLEGWEL